MPRKKKDEINLLDLLNSAKIDSVEEIEDEEYEEIQGIEIEISNLQNLKYNEKEFKKGLLDLSYIAGQLTALTTIGVDPNEALSYILAIQSIELQKVLAEKNNEMTLEVASKQVILQEKNML